MNEVRDASRRLLRAMNDLQAKGKPYAIVGPSMEVVLRAELEPDSNLVTDAILLLLDENALIEDEDTDYLEVVFRFGDNLDRTAPWTVGGNA